MSTMQKIDLLMTGVGGQGNISSDIIGDIALAAGYDVKKTDTLGMGSARQCSQSHPLAEKVYSPLIKRR